MNKDFDILFLGGLYPKETEIEIFQYSKTGVQAAANNFQWALVSGLDCNLIHPVRIINSLYIGSFPKRYKKLWIKSYSFSHKENATYDWNVGFINLTGIKEISRYYTLKPQIRKWLKEESSHTKVLIAYAMTGTFTSIIKYAKRRNQNILTCLIVPDLPRYMNISNNKSLMYDIFKTIEIKVIEKHMKYINCYVLLTKYMRKALSINCPSVVVEGIAEANGPEPMKITYKDSIKIIAYTGGLYQKYGILELIRSFRQLNNKNYRLVLCGTGDCDAAIMEESRHDNRIIYKGVMERAKILNLQREATVLVNPRRNNENYTKYSFPSKIIEYLSSGTPVIAYKLHGIPKEYYPYMYTPANDKEGLFRILKEVLEKPEEELIKKGIEARKFVLREKNSQIQTEKILHMLNLIREDQSCV